MRQTAIHQRGTGAFHSQADGLAPKMTNLKTQFCHDSIYLKTMFGVSDHHSNNLHSLMAHNDRCVHKTDSHKSKRYIRQTAIHERGT